MKNNRVLAVAVLFIVSPVFADAYKCRTPSGAAFFSESPCRDGSKQESFAGSGNTPPPRPAMSRSASSNQGGGQTQTMATADSCLKKIEGLGLSGPRLADATTACYQGARKGVDKKSADECVKRIESMGFANPVNTADGIVQCYGGTVKEDPVIIDNNYGRRW